MSCNSSNKSSGSKKRWKASFGNEQKKLAVSEDGWQLAGAEKITTWTRQKRNNSSSRAAASPEVPEDPPVAAVAATAPDIGDDTSNTGISALTTSSSFSHHSNRKPPSSRVIIDVTPVTTLLESHILPCPQCGARLKLSFPTVCIASGCELRCPFYGEKEDDCSFIIQSKPAAAGLTLPTHTESGRRTATKGVERNVDHSANILFVLSFIASSDSAYYSGDSYVEGSTHAIV